MNRIKKTTALILLVALCLALCACGSSESKKAAEAAIGTWEGKQDISDDVNDMWREMLPEMAQSVESQLNISLDKDICEFFDLSEKYYSVMHVNIKEDKTFTYDVNIDDEVATMTRVFCDGYKEYFEQLLLSFFDISEDELFERFNANSMDEVMTAMDVDLDGLAKEMASSAYEKAEEQGSHGEGTYKIEGNKLVMYQNNNPFDSFEFSDDYSKMNSDEFVLKKIS